MVSLPSPVKRVLRPARRRFRYATRKRRILPSFLIIGAQRAGTTSLFRYLLAHPDVAGPSGGDAAVWWVKETHFFDEKFTKGVDWYRSFFPLAATRERYRKRGHDLQAGEATPYYMFHPAVPARVAATLPDARLIALLRDPVERAYSHYQMMSRTGREKLDFEEAVAAEPERLAGVEEALMSETVQVLPSGHRAHHQHRHRAYFSRGLYADQLERWLEHFDREQLLVVGTEDLLGPPARDLCGGARLPRPPRMAAGRLPRAQQEAVLGDRTGRPGAPRGALRRAQRAPGAPPRPPVRLGRERS